VRTKKKEAVHDYARWHLDAVPSFARWGAPASVFDYDNLDFAGNLSDLFSSDIPGGVVGIYFNSNEDLDCLVLTENGILVSSPPRTQFFSYNDIEMVEKPVDVDEHLDVLLKSNERVFLSISGGREDVMSLYKFLSQLLGKNLSEEMELGAVKTRRDLQEFMCSAFWEEDEFCVWLSDGIKEDMKRAQIDPELLNHPDIWRFIGMVIYPPSLS